MHIILACLVVCYATALAAFAAKTKPEPNEKVTAMAFFVDPELQSEILALKTNQENNFVWTLFNESEDDLEVLAVRFAVKEGGDESRIASGKQEYAGVRVKANEDISLPFVVSVDARNVRSANARVEAAVDFKDEEGKVYRNMVLQKRVTFAEKTTSRTSKLLGNVTTIILAFVVAGVLGFIVLLAVKGPDDVANWLTAIASKKQRIS